MPESFLQNPLWLFAIEHYQNPKIEQALLQLQDCDACNINLLLWLGFLSAQNCNISIEAFKQVEASLAPLASTICQLRQYRKQCKNSEDKHFYQQIKQQELNLEQLYIAKLFEAEINGAKGQLVNLANYHEYFNISASGIKHLQYLSRNLLHSNPS